jgi:hypothetical protein
MEPQQSLLRRQYLVSRAQIEKLELLSRRESVSATEIVRRAIEAYDPDAGGISEAQALSALSAMAQVLSETRRELSELRERIAEGLSRERSEANRRAAEAEVREYYAAHPEQLEAISELFTEQEAPRHEHS